jgi:predicted ATPase
MARHRPPRALTGCRRSAWTTHSPVLRAYPNVRLLRLPKIRAGAGDRRTDGPLQDHKIMREFCADPVGFVEGVME